MIASRRRYCLVAATACVSAIAATATCGCAAPPAVTTGAFHDLAGLDAALIRGVATKADVRRTFGVPNGGGAARFFTDGGDEREIWYYEDIEATGVASAGGVMKFQFRQQMLVVMFKAGRVDGYLWTSNKDGAQVK